MAKDPKKEIERRHSSEIREMMHKNTLKKLAAKGDMEAQKMLMEMQQQMQQPKGKPGPAPQQRMSPAGNMTGQGANPAMGGLPPAIGGGDVTRETAQLRGK